MGILFKYNKYLSRITSKAFTKLTSCLSKPSFISPVLVGAQSKSYGQAAFVAGMTQIASRSALGEFDFGFRRSLTITFPDPAKR